MLSTISFLCTQPVKPKDFVFDEVLCTEEAARPKLLQEYSVEEKICILRKKILAVVNRKGLLQKKVSKRLVQDIGSSGMDQDKDPVARKTMQIFLWLVKKGSDVHGPFTEREMRMKMDSGELTGTLVRRDMDKKFIPYKNLSVDIDDFLSPGNLDKYLYFKEKAAAKDFVSEPKFPVVTSETFTKNQSKEEYSDLDRLEILERCMKSKDYLRTMDVSISLDHLERKISRKPFLEAIGIVASCTGLKRAESQEFLDIFLEESKLPILSDICQDGFIKVTEKPRKGMKRQ